MKVKFSERQNKICNLFNVRKLSNIELLLTQQTEQFKILQKYA